MDDSDGFSVFRASCNVNRYFDKKKGKGIEQKQTIAAHNDNDDCDHDCYDD